MYTMEYYTAERKKELLPFVTAWIELEYIILSEISSERQIPCDLTFNCNIIKKTNKGAKYNQRH